MAPFTFQNKFSAIVKLILQKFCGVIFYYALNVDNRKLIKNCKKI